MRRAAAALAAALALAACVPASGPAPSATRGEARGLTADAGGLQPAGTPLRIDFGRAEVGTVASVSKLLGSGPVETTLQPDCGAGPVTAVRWANGLTLNFQRGDFRGWVSAPGRGAPVTAAGGIGPGTPAEALGGAALRQTSLGAEFQSAGVSGLVQDGEVALVWAGATCLFR